MDLIMWEIILRHPSQAALLTRNSTFIAIIQGEEERDERDGDRRNQPS